MAIKDRIEKALADISEKDYENATIQLSIAIDGTAKKKYSKKLSNGARYRKFIDEHQEFIFYFALGCGARIVMAAKGAEFNFGERGALSNVLYKYVRNALLHEGDVSDNIIFKEEPSLGHEGDKFIIHPHMLLGLVLCVVGEDVNRNEQSIETEPSIVFDDKKLEVNNVWGKLPLIKQQVGF